jgi:hypothetical protein
MLRALVLAIAAITVVTGAAQIVFAGTMLELAGGRADASTGHLFATVGMFMVLFGAALWRAERDPASRGEILPWATLQKCGAALLVWLGVSRNVFAHRALLVAAFDAVSALVLAAHWLARRQ